MGVVSDTVIQISCILFGHVFVPLFVGLKVGSVGLPFARQAGSVIARRRPLGEEFAEVQANRDLRNITLSSPIRGCPIGEIDPPVNVGIVVYAVGPTVIKLCSYLVGSVAVDLVVLGWVVDNL